MPPKNEKNEYNTLPDGLSRFTADQFNLGAPNSGAQNVSIAYDVSSSGGGRKPGIDSLSGLRALPELRPVPWVNGKELPPDKSTDSPRTQTRGAFLLSTRGNVNNPPCSHCATGSGRFSICVSLEDFFHGACSTCQMATRGNLCSLRTGKDGESPSLSKSIELEQSRTPTLGGYNQPESSLKRKRSTPPPAVVHNAQLQSRNYSNYIQPGQGSPSGFTPSNIPTSNRLVGGQATPSNYAYQVDKSAYQVDKSANWPERVAPSFQTQSNLGRATLTSQTQNNFGGQYSAPTNSYNGRLGTGTQEREATNSMSPSTQLLQQAPQERAPLHVDPIPPQNFQPTSNSFPPLIDTLPRHKQKRIFGVIGGIQSGIRTVRQQADNLQRQLDLLQAEMGIDAEDDNGDG